MKKENYKMNYRFTLNYIIVMLLFCTPFATSYIIEFKGIYSLIFLTSIYLMIFIFLKDLKVYKRINIVIWMWVFTLIPLFYNSYSLSIGEYGVTIRYITIMFFGLLFHNQYKYIEIVYKIIKIFSMFYIISTLLINMFPIILKFIYFLMPANMSASSVLQSGFTNHYSTNAIYISIGFGIILSEYLTENVTLNKRCIWLVMGIISLILTNKRGLFIAVIFTTGVVYYLYKSNKPQERIIKLIIICVCAVVIGSCVASFTSFGRNFASRFNVSSEEFMTGRDKLYDLAIDLYKDNKVSGIGWGKYKHLSYLTGVTGDNQLLDTHNVYLNILCETGLIGLTIFLLAFFVSYFTTVIYYLKVRRNIININKKEMKYLTFSMFIQTFFLIYCVTGNPLYDIQTFYPYIGAITIMLSIKKRTTVKVRKTNGILITA